MTKILAIDQSYADTGLAVVEDGKPLYWQSIKPPKGMRVERRMYILAVIQDVCFPMYNSGLDLIVAEEGWGDPGIEIITSIENHAYNIGVEFAKLNPRSWKKKMLGNADADKDTAIVLAEQLTSASITNHNIADAVCIGVCAFRFPELLKKSE